MSYTEYASYKYLVHIMDGIAIIPRPLLPGNEVGLLCIMYTLYFSNCYLFTAAIQFRFLETMATVSEISQFIGVPIEILVSPPILQTDIVVSISVVGGTATGKSTVAYYHFLQRYSLL